MVTFPGLIDTTEGFRHAWMLNARLPSIPISPLVIWLSPPPRPTTIGIGTAPRRQSSKPPIWSGEVLPSHSYLARYLGNLDQAIQLS
jgi:hypothetical protein